MSEARGAMLLPVLLLSAAALALEVLLTRVLSYSVHTLLLYATLGVALLGFGASGTLVSLRPQWLLPERLLRVLAVSGLLSVVTVLGGLAVFVRVTPHFRQLDALTFGAAALLMLPFLSVATAITLAMASAGDQVGRTYGASLVGSGLGCFLPPLLLGPLVEEQVIPVLAGLLWLAALPWVRAARTRGLSLAHGVAAALVVLCFAFARDVFPLAPEPTPFGQLDTLRRYARAHDIRIRQVYDGASVVGRIQVFDFDGVPGQAGASPFLFYAQDSSAGSTFVRWDGRDKALLRPSERTNVTRLCRDTISGAGYYRERASVLVIGLGGAPDLLCALYEQAKHVDVVEINPRTIEAVRGPFDAFLGGAPRDPRVRFYLRDGRSFVHAKTPRPYDLIQLSGVDTKQNLASGSLTLSENHLYTLEAFRDYLSRLTDDGVLAIVRFGEMEALRLANTATVALRAGGARAPHQHIAVLQNDVLFAVLVRKTPFPASESDALMRWLASPAFEGLPVFFAKAYNLPFAERIKARFVPFRFADPVFAAFFRQASVSPDGPFTDAYAYNILPTTDDQPFFFDVFRRDDLATWMRAKHVEIMRNILLSVGLLALLLLLLPVLAQRDALRGASRIVAPVYFSCLGLGYLLIEVWLLRRFAMYLGHETHGLSVVLAAMLVSSGAGAALASRADRSPRARALAGALGTLVVLATLRGVLGPVLEATWSLPMLARVAMSIAAVAPLGVCMGVCLPAGLDWARTAYPGSVPFCIGVNGFAGVIATIAVLPLSLWFGYSGVLAIGAALYAAAALAAWPMR